MTTRILTNQGVLKVGESPDEVRELIKQTSDGFITLQGISGTADQDMPEGGSITINITEITLFREIEEKGKSERSLNSPALTNRSHGGTE